MNTPRNVIILIALVALFAFSCENGQTPSQEEVEAALSRMISADEALNIDELGDGAALDEEYGDISESLGKLLDDYYPSDSLRFRFGRQIESHDRAIDHEFLGDSVVISTITHNVSGNFITVIFDTAGALVDSFVKEFTIDAVRKVKFVRIGDSEDASRNWRLAGLTLITSQAGNKIGIDSLNIYDGRDGGLLYSFLADDILDTFIDRESIPTFTVWQNLVFKLYVSNGGPAYDWRSGEGALLRFGFGRRIDGHHRLHARRRFFDDGSHGDAVANDDEFTRIWVAHPPGLGADRRIFKMFVDVIDYETLFSSNGSYNSVLWGFPYRSIGQ